MTFTDADAPIPEFVTDVQGFQALENDWGKLYESSEEATVFQSFAWNFIWWKHFGHKLGRRLCLLVFRSPLTSEIVGLAPLMRTLWYATPLVRLSFIGTGTSDYLDVLAAPDAKPRIMDAFYRAIENISWSIADFQQLRATGVVMAQSPPPIANYDYLDVFLERCPYVKLLGSWSDLLLSLGKKTRSNVNYYERNVAKTHDVEYKRVEDESEIPKEMHRLFQLHQRRWNERWLPGVFGSSGIRHFHSEVAIALARVDALRLFCLRLDGETQASLYCFKSRGRMMYYQGGFEPTLSKYSLGTILTGYALRQALEEGLPVFDFLRGNEPYKAKWTQESETNSRRFVTRRKYRLIGLVRKVQRIEESVELRAKAWARSRR